MPGHVHTSGDFRSLLGDEPRDFGVSMRDDVLAHKLRDGRAADGRYCYWTFPHTMPAATEGSRLWVANRGRWVGYFVIVDLPFATKGRKELAFYSESFVRNDGGARSPFMGYTFKVPPREEP